MAGGDTYTSSNISQTDVLITRTNLTIRTGNNHQHLNQDAQCYIIEDLGIPIGDCPDLSDPPPPPLPPTSCGLPMLNCIEAGRPKERIRIWDTQL